MKCSRSIADERDERGGEHEVRGQRPRVVEARRDRAEQHAAHDGDGHLARGRRRARRVGVVVERAGHRLALRHPRDHRVEQPADGEPDDRERGDERRGHGAGSARWRRRASRRAARRRPSTSRTRARPGARACRGRSCRARPAPGRGEQWRLHRVIHGVDHELARVEPVRRRWAAARPACPSGVALTTRSNAPGSQSPRAAPRPRRATSPAADSAASFRRAATVTRRPGLPERERDRPRRAAGAEHERGARCRGRRPRRGPQRRKPSPSVDAPRHRPRSIGTTAFTAPSAVASGVSSSHAHAASCLCGIVTLMPAEPQAVHGLHRVASRPGGYLERDEHPVETRRRERGVVDRGRARVPDRVADDRREPGGPGHGRRHSPLTPCSRMFCSCSASVVAKRVTPSLPVT